jgi:nitroimidazol reductase NimA-like FMN-containing flavoprotein (pyridoxamine 5'-phosphate oxidase superfamily)
LKGAETGDHAEMKQSESSDHLKVLDREECLRRLEAHGVGRIGAIVCGRPVVYPVNYAIYDGAIVFRTRRGGELDSATNGEVAAFEIDDVDHLYHEGWSVLVVGRCSPVNDVAELEGLSDVRLSPWADEKRDRFVRIPFDRVSGRHISHQMTVPAEIAATSAAEEAELPADSLADAPMRELQEVDEPQRIDRDLHDRVIQRAFGVALHLSSVIDDVATDSGDRLKEMVRELDQVIADIRTTIFDVQSRSR